MKQTKPNKRRIFFSPRVRLLFAGYLIFTLVLVLAIFGKLFLHIFVSIFSPGMVEQSTDFSTRTQFFLFFLWTLYGYFFAYFYASNRIHGVIHRMGGLFDRIAQGEITHMTFRKKDPFHPVAQSFNRMLGQVALHPEWREELEKISQLPAQESKSALEKFLQKIKK